jgi:hypothetical protein
LLSEAVNALVIDGILKEESMLVKALLYTADYKQAL